MIRAGVVGGSGYAGGELVRLLLGHPEVQLDYVTSTRHAGEFVHQVHPNLRQQTRLKFTSPQQLEPTEALFLALPHGEAQQDIDRFAGLAPRLVDLSADFRLRSADDYQRWYGAAHAAPEWLGKFVYGLPELTRAALGGARYVSGVGCNAAASILCLLPLVRADLLDRDQPIVIELKVGSSEGGADGSAGSHHPERSGVIRTFSTFGHRHTGEVIQAFGLTDVSLTMTSVDLVRGVLATAHARIRPGITTQDLWRAYRELAEVNPFVRVVREARGIYRVPEPKILAGSNYADLGFDLDESTGHVISICAIDNLMKGAAGSAVQCLNLMFGWDEALGLGFPGLHPI